MRFMMLVAVSLRFADDGKCSEVEDGEVCEGSKRRVARQLMRSADINDLVSLILTNSIFHFPFNLNLNSCPAKNGMRVQYWSRMRDRGGQAPQIDSLIA